MNCKPRCPAAIVSLILCIMLLTAACPPSGLKKPIASFHSSMERTGDALRIYYLELNKRERDLYFEELLSDPEMKLEEVDAQGNPTPLLHPVIAESAIAARLEVIKLLQAYAGKLNSIVNSDAPARIPSSLDALKGKFDDLAKQYVDEDLIGRAKQYSSAVTKLAKVLLGNYLQHRIEQGLVEAIEAGDEPIAEILDALQEDMEDVREICVNNTNVILTRLIGQYNRNRANWDYFQKREILKRIRSAAQRYLGAEKFRPAKLFAGVRAAHRALVEYAKSGRRRPDLMRLLEAVEQFRQDVRTIVEAVNEIMESQAGA